MNSTKLILAAGGALALAGQSAHAKDPAVELVKCDQSLGTVALVDGDQAGWSEWGLGSPRALINALAVESGCFTPHNAAGGAPARFLLTAIAGSEEQVDKGVEMAKAGATEALLRSGAMGSVLGKVPFAGSALGMLGGLGGKKKTVAAGLKVVSPANGMAVAAGSGTVKKSSLTFGGGSWAASAAAGAGYQGSKNGEMLTEAFILAFNQLVAQRDALGSAPQAGAAAAAGTGAGATVAVDTAMRASPLASATSVRALRAGTTLAPTGRREGLFVEVKDNFGTSGWVSVEDLK
ncbi:SH3 domain-containing protein [Tsuneonella sp. HG222]